MRRAFGQPAELHQRTNMLLARQAVLRRSMMEKEPEELTLADQGIEFGRGHVDQETDEDPEMDRDEPVPCEVEDRVPERRTEATGVDGERHDLLRDTHDQHDDRVEDRLVENRPDQRAAAKLVDESNLVDHQNDLGHHQRGRRGQDKVRQIEPDILDRRMGGEGDQVEDDEEIDHRRKHMPNQLRTGMDRPTFQGSGHGPTSVRRRRRSSAPSPDGCHQRRATAPCGRCRADRPSP